MVDRNIINKLGLTREKLDKQVSEMFTEEDNKYLEKVLEAKVDSRLPGTILKGKIISQIGNDVIVEVGLKSEGMVDVSEFDSSDEIEPGREIEVLLEDMDTEGGLIPLSKRKADRIRGWEHIINTKKEDDIVTGRVIRRIKGGLLIDISVPVFLPASQVDIRKPGDISRFIGKEIECKILKIDIEGRNIVVSRRRLIEEQRRESKEQILEEIEVGQLRKGVVKNIADFGVFVDLGGLDGLLHISDLSWGRISHPSEILELDQEIECVIIGVNKEKEKVSLGLKQKTSSPWEDVEQRCPIGARVKGKVVNIMNYGVFVRLEDGIEGLVHISEMSWTKRLSHPSEMLSLGDEIEVVVLSVNKDKQEISLGLKQTETNPWAVASQKYPSGIIVTATVRSITNFGVFVEIEEGIHGMIHISDLSWTRKYNHPGEAVQRGDEIKCVVLEVDAEKQRISLGIKQMTEDPWARAIPDKYIPGHIIKGKITKITNFGAFVELEPELEGLLHISELADHKIDKPQDVVKEGDEVEIKILKVEIESRKIGLSLRRAQWAAEEQEEAEETKPAAVETVLSETDSGKDTEPKAGEAETEEESKKKEKKAKAEKKAVKKEQQDIEAKEEADQSEEEKAEPTAEGDTQVQAEDSKENKAEEPAEGDTQAQTEAKAGKKATKKGRQDVKAKEEADQSEEEKAEPTAEGSVQEQAEAKADSDTDKEKKAGASQEVKAETVEESKEAESEKSGKKGKADTKKDAEEDTVEEK